MSGSIRCHDPDGIKNKDFRADPDSALIFTMVFIFFCMIQEIRYKPVIESLKLFPG